MTVQTNPPPLIYKILPRAEHESALSAGIYTGSAIDRQDGFIHFSTAGQLAETLRRHYAGQSDLLILAVRTAALSDRLAWEPSRGGALFPHLYGPMPLSAVEAQAAVAVDAEGGCALPDMVR